jgi:hypothetical protein
MQTASYGDGVRTFQRTPGERERETNAVGIAIMLQRRPAAKITTAPRKRTRKDRSAGAQERRRAVERAVDTICQQRQGKGKPQNAAMPLLWKKPRHEKEKRKGKERKGREPKKGNTRTPVS